MDPYAVLGVERNASDDDIKKAYRKLSRKYHPDANVNNPDKEWAEEKFKQIQAAYQQVMNERTRGYAGYGSTGAYNANSQNSRTYSNGYGRTYRRNGFEYQYRDGADHFGGAEGYGSGYESDPKLRAAGNFIRNRYYREARTTLDSMEQSARNAVWYYYSAVAHAGLGNNISALEHARAAAAMEPNNPDYRFLLEQLENGINWYASRQSSYGFRRTSGANICVKICAANVILNFLLTMLCGGGGFFCGGL